MVRCCSTHCFLFCLTLQQFSDVFLLYDLQHACADFPESYAIIPLTVCLRFFGHVCDEIQVCGYNNQIGTKKRFFLDKLHCLLPFQSIVDKYVHSRTYTVMWNYTVRRAKQKQYEHCLLRRGI